MNKLTRASLLSLCLAATGLFALAQPASAHEGWSHGESRHHQAYSPQEREAWAKQHLEKEASMLEIKASQQAAWDEYAAAKLDLMNSFGAMRQGKHDEVSDAAAIARKHAERLTQLAQKLTTLAQATEKLQNVLGDDQRKVLNRIASHHHHFGHHHGFHGQRDHEGKAQAGETAKAPAKPAANKAKQSQ